MIPLTYRIMIDMKEVATYSEYNHLLDLQRHIHQSVMPTSIISLKDNQGHWVALTLADDVPINAVPAVYWLSLLNVIGVIIATAVYIAKPNSLEGNLFMIAAFGHYCLSTGFTALLCRDLFMNADLLRTVVFLQVIALHMLIFGVFSIHIYHPKRILPVWFLYINLILQVCWVINYRNQWIEIPLHIFFLPVIVYFLAFIPVSIIQWINAKKEPISLVALLISQMTVIIMTLIGILSYVIPIVMKVSPVAGGVIINFMPVIVFIGWAIAILRYRLFDIEQWWFKIWIWLLGGVLVGVIDLVLMGWVHASHFYSLGFSVIIAGFVYFPLRQWLLMKMMPLDSQSVQSFLPVFSELMGGASLRTTFEQRWQTALQARFQPLDLNTRAGSLVEARLEDSGLYLNVPTLQGNAHLRLTGKQTGRRLFGRADLQTVMSLLAIARIASNASEIRQQAVLTERTRIMHDLHDTVGAKLLTLTHTLPAIKHQQVAKEALWTLRDIINLTLHPVPPLGEYLADWRLEAMERAEAKGITLDWQVDALLEALHLPGIELASLATTLRDGMEAAFAQQPSIQTLQIRVQPVSRA